MKRFILNSPIPLAPGFSEVSSAAFTRLPRRGGVLARAARVGCRLLDQPFYGWGLAGLNIRARFTVLIQPW
jgi:hypothetical protein